MRRTLLPLAALALAVASLAVACGAGTSSSLVPGASPERGARLIERYGCGSCHEIAGVQLAGGRVGPSLRHFKDDRFIAGHLGNSPENAIRWIMHPQRIEPGTIMPDLGVSKRDARDIVAYLYAH
jgi:cytochrome c2